MAGVTMEQRKQVLIVIWVAMLAAVGSYAAVSLLLVGPGTARDDDNDLLRSGFTLAAIAMGGLSLWWRRRFLAPGPADAPAAAIAFDQLRSHGIIVWALSEAVAICGLVLGFITHSFAEFVPFGLAAGALLILHRPASLPFERVRPEVG